MEDIFSDNSSLPRELQFYTLKFFDEKTLGRLASVSKNSQYLSERGWFERIKMDITDNPNLTDGQTYQHYYKRAQKELLLPIENRIKKLINKKGNQTFFPLQIAAKAEYNCEKIILSLLNQHKLDVNNVDDYNASALFYAAEQGNVALVKLLLAHGAHESINLCCCINYNKPETSFEAAVRAGNLTLVKLFLELGANDLVNYRKSYFVRFAAESNNADMVEFILNHGLQPDRASLKAAIELDNVKSAELLLITDANLNKNNYKGLEFPNIVLSDNTPNMINLLIKYGLQPKKENLILILRESNPDLYQLLKNIAAVQLAENSFYCSYEKLVDSVIAPNDLNIVKVLLSSNFPIDVHLLAKACRSGQVALIKLLLDSGGKQLINHEYKINDATYNAYLNDKKTILFDAIESNNLEAVELLTQYGANFNYKARGEVSLLHWASLMGNAQIIERLINLENNPGYMSNSQFRKYLTGLKPIDRMDGDRHTALHYAIMSGKAEAVKILLSHHPKLFEEDKTGNTILEFAIRLRSFDITVPLTRDIQITVSNESKIEIIKLLINAGARITPRALKFAKELNSEPIINLLESYQTNNTSSLRY